MKRKTIKREVVIKQEPSRKAIERLGRILETSVYHAHNMRVHELHIEIPEPAGRGKKAAMFCACRG